MRTFFLFRCPQVTRWFAALAVCLVLVGVFGAVAGAQQQQPPPKTAAQEGFVPVTELPPEDRLPAAPLLVAAYSVAWVAMLVYVWSVWRRLGRVEQELAALQRRVDPGQRSGARP
jgi:CcmD family protein